MAGPAGAPPRPRQRGRRYRQQKEEPGPSPGDEGRGVRRVRWVGAACGPVCGPCCVGGASEPVRCSVPWRGNATPVLMLAATAVCVPRPPSPAAGTSSAASSGTSMAAPGSAGAAHRHPGRSGPVCRCALPGLAVATIAAAPPRSARQVWWHSCAGSGSPCYRAGGLRWVAHGRTVAARSWLKGLSARTIIRHDSRSAVSAADPTVAIGVPVVGVGLESDDFSPHRGDQSR